MKIHGLNECLKRLQFDDKEIGKALQSGGELILNQTKTNMDKDATIANSYNMTVSRTESGGWIVNVGSDIALSAFYEWGTGDYVVVPPETTDAYTMQWFRTGRGTLRPYPHLLPAFRQYRDKIIESIKEAISSQF